MQGGNKVGGRETGKQVLKASGTGQRKGRGQCEPHGGTKGGQGGRVVLSELTGDPGAEGVGDFQEAVLRPFQPGQR